MNNILQKISNLLTYVKNIKKQAAVVGMISNRDSIELTDEMIIKIFPSWLKLKANDIHIPDSLFGKVEGIKEANLLDLKKYFVDSGMEKSFENIVVLKSDYERLVSLGGVYNYVVRLVNKYIPIQNKVEIENAAAEVANFIYQRVTERFVFGKSYLLKYIKDQTFFNVKNREVRYFSPEERRNQHSKFMLDTWETEFINKHKRPPTEDEMEKAKRRYDKQMKYTTGPSDASKTMIHRFYEPSGESPEDRDSALDACFNKHAPSNNINSVEFNDLKKNLWSLLKNNGLTKIQLEYLKMVLVDRDPQLWIGHGETQRVNQGYLSNKLKTNKTNIANHLKALSKVINKLMETDDEFQIIKDSLSGMSMRANIDSKEEKKIKKLISEILHLDL